MGSKDKKDLEEIEIQLDGDTPLSKKELRRIKKGKITLEEIQKKKAKKLAKAAASGNESKVSNESGEVGKLKNVRKLKMKLLLQKDQIMVFGWVIYHLIQLEMKYQIL